VNTANVDAEARIAHTGGLARVAGACAHHPWRVIAGWASVFVLLIVLEVSRWPIPDPNGGWPAAAASGTRIVATTGSNPIALLDLPAFKTPAGTGFPIVMAGGTLTDDVWSAAFIVVPCDRLFESVVGLKCAGPAEGRQIHYLVADGAHPEPTLVTRFDASPRISISIYRP